MSDEEKKTVRHYRYAGNQAGWWVAFMDELGFISVLSDWGDYNHCWSSRGDEGGRMRQWISTTMAKDRDYVTKKFAKGQKEIDPDASKKAILEAIESSDLTAGQKKVEKMELRSLIFDDQESLREWHEGSRLEDKHELLRYQPPQQLLMFMEKVWPHVCAAAGADLAANP